MAAPVGVEQDRQWSRAISNLQNRPNTNSKIPSNAADPSPLSARRHDRCDLVRVGSSRRRPSWMPSALARLRPAMTRSRIIERSNSANTPSIWNIARPDGINADELEMQVWDSPRCVAFFGLVFFSLTAYGGAFGGLRHRS
jgi:hypothetical protein